MTYGLCFIVSAVLAYVVILCWICGANDGSSPAFIGNSRGARLIQASPIYKLAYYLYEAAK